MSLHRASDHPMTSINFNDARSMALTSCIPVAAISLLIAMISYEMAGFPWAAIAFLASLLILLGIRTLILVSVRSSDVGIVLRTLGRNRTLTWEQIERSSVHGFKPAFAIFLVIWITGRISPVVAFAGALSTSEGSFVEAKAQLTTIMQATSRH